MNYFTLSLGWTKPFKMLKNEGFSKLKFSMVSQFHCLVLKSLQLFQKENDCRRRKIMYCGSLRVLSKCDIVNIWFHERFWLVHYTSSLYEKQLFVLQCWLHKTGRHILVCHACQLLGCKSQLCKWKVSTAAAMFTLMTTLHVQAGINSFICSLELKRSHLPASEICDDF